MHFSQTALIVLPLFATFVICAPIAQQDTLDLRAPTESIADAVLPRAPQTKAQLTAAYHQAENDAKSALASAKSMDASLKGKAPQAADTAKMRASILTAYRSGHEYVLSNPTLCIFTNYISQGREAEGKLDDSIWRI
jgi:hypothetical protein